MNKDAVALRIGWLVIASAMLELQVGMLAEFLSGTPRNASQGQQIGAIRKSARSRADSEAIQQWAVAANDLLKERGLLVHGGFLGQWEGNEMVPAYIAHRRGDIVDVGLDRLDRLIELARRLEVEGREHTSKVASEMLASLGKLPLAP